MNKENQITAEDLFSTITGLTLWNWLVPPSSYPLMPPDWHTIHGEVLFGRRMWEGKSSVTRWMSTGKVEAGLALLMADGRYSDDVVIIPPSYSGLVLNLLNFTKGCCSDTMAQTSRKSRG